MFTFQRLVSLLKNKGAIKNKSSYVIYVLKDAPLSL